MSQRLKHPYPIDKHDTLEENITWHGPSEILRWMMRQYGEELLAEAQFDFHNLEAELHYTKDAPLIKGEKL